MRLAIVSDTHLPRGRRRVPDTALQLMREADLILHAGDISTEEALAEIQALGPPVRAVHGNADSAALKELLPASLELELEGRRLAIVHNGGPAAGRLARLARRFPDVEAIVFGHSHIPLHEREGGVQIFNPGSLTDRRRQPRHSMGVARVDAEGIALEHVLLDP